MVPFNRAASGAALALIASSLALAGCGGGPRLPFTGGGAKPAAAQTGIGVNAFLWRATLDTLSFMPLLTADPWGGVVNYDWYVNPQTPNERFKATRPRSAVRRTARTAQRRSRPATNSGRTRR